MALSVSIMSFGNRVNHSGKVLNASLYRSARPDYRIRIRHWPVDTLEHPGIPESSAAPL